ncbi:hypothetical protein H112_03490 [Trichophyton rubrum D6]|uniref:Mesaconyl-C4 CoA hydratase n=3 Tax=Trichophyton TaxID=5550 RepID=F2SQF3_TRIRC|nr:uncharacterized protein TERG_04817 [Trichophyton rubrum CBS 118892]EZF23906.1 hypothetical protein H100_03493 [Trichophyton rubrum MR850]EZF43027.1 hypothetical protein H102_03488 [Trichophyton rubrum CBS 100081]EZF53585.1 hypothetical protein H103_03498 [Trichophyton rubrum CBS 288.86]EZF64175.1 hypothetical protein H104_03483 [Trichophyton rubrum CBS 289.86]EZF74833.1 hypothetical protein H105_03510 [Trichophyton soudanense CBS 452.61]EZF85494.1 hypothetical protein H110_03494 [Trichophy
MLWPKRSVLRPVSATTCLVPVFPAFRHDTQYLARPHSTNAQGNTAPGIAGKFLAKFQSIGPQKRTQVLDANQLQLLSLTLNKNHLYPGYPPLSFPPSQAANQSASVLATGIPVPPGYHLVYFTPQFLEEHLGPDGTDVSYNPDPPFTRRMWAGGEMIWPRDRGDKRPNLLRAGQIVTETTKLLSAEPKIIKKTGDEMIVVGVEKTFENENGVALIDRRNWVFRKALKASPPGNTPSRQIPPVVNTLNSPGSLIPTTSTNNVYTLSLKQSPVTLFRFSALTFNPHKIHYSVPWAQDVEGHRNIVVHGPLNLISMLNFWRETRNRGDKDPELIIPERIKYRATHPLYADEEYRLVLEDTPESSKIDIYNLEGKVSMNAEIIN